jgi:hypothetical protein
LVVDTDLENVKIQCNVRLEINCLAIEKDKNMPNFDEFWEWLTNLPGDYQIHHLGENNFATIVTHNDDGEITPDGGKAHHFNRQNHVLPIWIRFHGLWQAEQFFSERPQHYPNFAPIDGHRPFLMASSYALPLADPLPQNWHGVPNPICCPWIAAAIKGFYLENYPALLPLLH